MLNESQGNQQDNSYQHQNPDQYGENPAQGLKKRPHTVSIYEIPKAPVQKQPAPPSADYYRAITANTSVRQDIIDALGGITDTVKPLEMSLRQHEMRPFDVEPNYLEDLHRGKAIYRNDKNSVRSHMGQTKDELY